MKNNERYAVFSGTFDPVTAGHADIIARTAKLFDRVYVAIAVNPDKKSMFTKEERLEMAKAAVEELGVGDRVECVIWDRPVFELCREKGAGYIVKGVRNTADFDYEKLLAKQTESLCGDIETVCLFSDSRYDYLSSTYVRGCIEYGLPIEGALPSSVLGIVRRITGGDGQRPEN